MGQVRPRSAKPSTRSCQRTLCREAPAQSNLAFVDHADGSFRLEKGTVVSGEKIAHRRFRTCRRTAIGKSQSAKEKKNCQAHGLERNGNTMQESRGFLHPSRMSDVARRRLGCGSPAPRGRSTWQHAYGAVTRAEPDRSDLRIAPRACPPVVALSGCGRSRFGSRTAFDWVMSRVHKLGR